jgi:YesN/AraC family two-component response regulator
MMPVMDGITMCKALKTNLSTSHIPVVLLSAKNDIDTKLESMGLNADDFIEKPFSPEYLKARVKNILEIRENLKSHFSQGHEDESKLNGLNPVDQQFLEKSNKIIEERISDPDFSVNILVRELALNRVQLYRKFSSITGLLPKDYIKQIRLNKAAKLLRERQLTVAEIGYAVGYSAPSNFNFAFKAYYGKTPKEYQEGF